MNTTYLSLPSPAKVNLQLNIINKRADGYHNIKTVFQYLDFCDHFTFNLRQDKKITLKTPMININHNDNLIIKAATLLQQQYQCNHGVEISIDKNIPMGAGLGGGSSNAATTLLALNYLWGLHLTKPQLIDIGSKLGADVPFFIFGHAAFGEGIGDILSPMVLPEKWYLLINPNIHISTSKLYNSPKLKPSTRNITITSFNIDTATNDFEPIILDQYPQIADIFNWLQPISSPRITGSGSTIYTIFDTREEASTIAALAPAFCSTQVVKGLNTSPLHNALAN